MKSNKSLKEIKVVPGTGIIMDSYASGRIYIDGKPIGIEKVDDEYHLDGYDEEIYNRFKNIKRNVSTVNRTKRYDWNGNS